MYPLRLPDIDGYAPTGDSDGEPRCAAHYVTPTDGALVLAAVEELGVRMGGRKDWKLLPGDDITDPAPPSANGARRCQCGLALSVVAVGDRCGRCAAREWDNAQASAVKGTNGRGSQIGNGRLGDPESGQLSAVRGKERA